MSASGYIDKKHRKLARDLEDAERTWRIGKRVLIGWALLMAACIAAVIGSGFVAAMGIPYAPAAMAWTGSVVGVASLILTAMVLFLILDERGSSDSSPWKAVADARREMDDYVEDKVMDDAEDKPQRGSWSGVA